MVVMHSPMCRQIYVIGQAKPAMGDAKYSIDSSILIGNWRDLYPPDVFPGV